MGWPQSGTPWRWFRLADPDRMKANSGLVGVGRYGVGQPDRWVRELMAYEIRRPTELADWFGYVEVYAPSFPEEDGHTTASAFAIAFKALESFVQHTPTDEGKERLRQCDRNLRLAFEAFEKGDDISGSRLVQETAQMFQKCRKYIDVSDA